MNKQSGHVQATATSARRVDNQNTAEKRARERDRPFRTVPAAHDAHFRKIVEKLPSAVYTTDAEGLITYFNEAAAELWGRRPEIGEDWWCGSWRLFWPDGSPMEHDECPMAIALRTGEPIDGMEALAERPDGTRFPFLAYPTPLRDESGSLTGAVNMLVDISDSKRSGKRLRESEVRYRNLFWNVRVSVWEEDFSGVLDWMDERRADGVRDIREYLETHPDSVAEAFEGARVVDVNNFTVELFEAEDADELLGNLSHILLPETRDALVDELEALWEGRRYVESETAVQTLKGNRLDIMFTIAFEGERCECTFVTVLDISDRKKAELARQQLVAIVESSDDAIMSKDLDGTIISWNDGAQRLFGYPAKEIVGKPVTTLMSPEHREEEPGIIARVRAGERVEPYETIRRHKDGTDMEVSLSVSPVKDFDGKVIGASSIARDISGQKEAERTLSAQRKRLATLNSIAKSISSDLDLEHVVQTVTDIATELSGAKFGAFFYNVTRADGESLFLYTLSGAPREAFEKFGLPRNTAVFEPTFRGTGVVRSDDIRKDARYGKNAPHNGMPKGHLPVVSYLAVPVKSRSGEVMGGLFFGHSEPGVFTKDSELLIKGIASHAAIAIDNARLHEAAQAEIDERRRAEEAKEILLNEIKHRIKNTLATVQAIASQSFHSATGDDHESFHSRVQALAGAYDLLTDDKWDRVPVGEVVDQVLAPFRERRKKRFRMSGGEVWLDANKSVLLAMALHEMATNAVKYGALSNKQGQVRIEWNLADSTERPRLKVCWQEVGGPPVSPPTRKGFGSKLIERSLVDKDGAAEFEFAPEGVKCTLEIALD